MPQTLKLVIIELAGVAVIVGGCWALFIGNPFGLVALLTGQRLLLRPGETGAPLERVVELTTRLRRRGPEP